MGTTLLKMKRFLNHVFFSVDSDGHDVIRADEMHQIQSKIGDTKYRKALKAVNKRLKIMMFSDFGENVLVIEPSDEIPRTFFDALEEDLADAGYIVQQKNSYDYDERESFFAMFVTWEPVYIEGENI